MSTPVTLEVHTFTKVYPEGWVSLDGHTRTFDKFEQIPECIQQLLRVYNMACSKPQPTEGNQNGNEI